MGADRVPPMSLFDRAPADYKPLIEAGWAKLTPRMRRELTPRFLCGVDPRFAGLHYYEGRGTYAWNPHCCFTFHTPDRHQRIVIPTLDERVDMIVHEAAHMFDEITHFELDAPITTAYSRTNRRERIAEAIEEMLMPRSGQWDAYMRGEQFRPLRHAIGLS